MEKSRDLLGLDEGEQPGLHSLSREKRVLLFQLTAILGSPDATIKLIPPRIALS